MAPPVPVEPRARRLRLKFSDILAVLALVVSIGSVTISFTQTGNVKRQLQLAELQIRPYIRYKPRFIEDGNDQLDISMISENHSAIPGNVIYDQLKIWIDDKTTSAFLFNRTGDILYQHKNGVSDLSRMPDELAKTVRRGKVILTIGTCVVY